MISWKKLPVLWRYAIPITLSLLVSIAGVFRAVEMNPPQSSEGGRGGAIATVVAFFILFLRPDFGRKIYEARVELIDRTLPKIDQLTKQVAAMEAWLMINSTGQSHQNRALVIASIISTIFWGFGDWAAVQLAHFLGISLPSCIHLCGG